MELRYVPVVLTAVLLAGCLGGAGETDPPGFDDLETTEQEIIADITASDQVQQYARSQTNPQATASVTSPSRINASLSCGHALGTDTTYIRVAVFGDDSVLDVWVSTDDHEIVCSKELSTGQAREEGITLGDTVPVEITDDGQQNDTGDGENNTGENVTNESSAGGDLSLAINGFSPTQNGYSISVTVSSNHSAEVATTLQYGTASRSITAMPGDNTYSITTTKTGSMTVAITENRGIASNNEATVTLPEKENDNETSNNQTDNETGTNENPPNVWVDAFTVSDDTPASGDEIDFEVSINASAFQDQLELVITDSSGQMVVSDTLSVSGPVTETYTYTYDDGEEFTLSLDPEDTYNETDETDNAASLAVSPTASGDVTISSVSTSPSDPHDQENISLVATLDSDGYSGDVTVAFAVDGSRVGSTTVSITSGLTTEASLRHVADDGQHTLTATVNLSDTNTSNNDASGTYDVAGYRSFSVNWKHDIGYPPLNLAPDQGRLYTIAGGFVFAINASNGDIAWQNDVGHNVESPLSPILAEGNLFYGENEGNKAVGFNISTRSVDWTYRTGYSVRSGAAYADGKVFMGSDDGSMYAYDAANGDVIWSKGGGELRSRPAVNGNTVYHAAWQSATLYARSTQNGDQKWSADLNGKVERSSPYVGSSNVYLGTTSEQLYAVSRSSHSVNWTFDSGAPIHSSPIKTGQKVVFGGNGTIHAVWATNHTAAWNVSTVSDSIVTGSPVAAAGTVYIGGPGGVFYGIALSSGDVVCQYDTGTGSITTRPTVVGDAVYTGTESNKVFSFQTCPT